MIEDFEIDPPNPMQQLCQIIELAHQCVTARKAYVSVAAFGGNESVTCTLTTDFIVSEYLHTDDVLLIPNHVTLEIMRAYMSDQPALQAMIDRLKEVLV